MTEMSIRILKRSSLQVAPEAIWFRAALDRGAEDRDYDENFHHLRYLWDFGDPGATTDKVVNVPRAHTDLNRAFGQHAVHVFTRPGSYQVTCTVHDRDGLVGMARLDVEIADPETVFPAAQTVLLSHDASRSARHPDAQIVETWEDAASALEELDAPGRLLLPRGANIEVTGQGFGRRNPNVYLSSWGPDAASPVLRTNSQTKTCLRIDRDFEGDFVLTGGIRLIGDWDSTTEDGVHSSSASGLRVPAYHDTVYVVVDETYVSGFGQGITLIRDFDDRGPKTTSFVLHNSIITNWGDYGIWGGSNRKGFLGLIGSVIAQDPEAMQGGAGGRDFEGNQQGPVRISHHGHVVVDACDLFSRNGWTQVGTSGLPGQQPCLRLGASLGDGSMRAVVTRNAMEGGGPVLTARRAGRDDTPHPVHILVEKNYLMASAYSGQLISVNCAGITLRNNIGVKPDMDFLFGRWTGAIVAAPLLPPDYSAPENGGYAVEVYNNTIACLLNDENRNDHRLTLTEDIDDWTIFSDENNVIYTPNAPSQQPEDPILETVPIETAGGTWRPRFHGLKFNHYPGLRAAQTTMDTRWATPEGI